MRTNIEIDDQLMARAMEAGAFKTKREAVEEGLRLIARRKTYDGLLALRGKLHWDDSDQAWAQRRSEAATEHLVQEALVAESTKPYLAQVVTPAAPSPKLPRATKRRKAE